MVGDRFRMINFFDYTAPTHIIDFEEKKIYFFPEINMISNRNRCVDGHALQNRSNVNLNNLTKIAPIKSMYIGQVMI